MLYISTANVLMYLLSFGSLQEFLFFLDLPPFTELTQ